MVYWRTTLGCVLLSMFGCDREPRAVEVACAPLPEVETATTSEKSGEYPVAPPELDYFPCSECHEDMEPNLERRELEEEHTDIELHHGPEERWCLDCHDPENRDQLRLASGVRISFNESYRLCGQCHGPKLRDWRVGVHGKRTGSWNGKKSYLLCAHCHNPHAPAFAPLAPMPPPTRPAEQRL